MLARVIMPHLPIPVGLATFQHGLLRDAAEGITEKATLTADLRDNYILTMTNADVTSLNYDQIMNDNPSFKVCEGLISMAATPARKRLSQLSASGTVDTTLELLMCPNGL